MLSTNLNQHQFKACSQVHMQCKKSTYVVFITLYLIEMPNNAFANRADPDQAALVRAA